MINFPLKVLLSCLLVVGVSTFAMAAIQGRLGTESKATSRIRLHISEQVQTLSVDNILIELPIIGGVPKRLPDNWQEQENKLFYRETLCVRASKGTNYQVIADLQTQKAHESNAEFTLSNTNGARVPFSIQYRNAPNESSSINLPPGQSVSLSVLDDNVSCHNFDLVFNQEAVSSAKPGTYTGVVTLFITVE